MSIKQGQKEKMSIRKPINYSYVIIYKITCLPNGKVYIGQTTNSLKRRFQGHTWSSSGCIKLHRAIKKYNKENFIIEQIDHAHSKEEADAKEKAYISLYNSTNNKCGYNITKGGETTSSKSCRPVMCLETGKKYDSLTEAHKEVSGKKSGAIQNVCSGRKRSFKGFRWAYLDKEGNPILDNIDFSRKEHLVKIICVETGEIFNSIREASKAKGISEVIICRVLKGKGKTAGGFHWRSINRENPLPKPISKNRKKIKIICTETGEIFDSIFQCAKKLGIYRSNIYSSLINGHFCKGFHFKFIEKEK